jgi:hypothetical protein
MYEELETAACQPATVSHPGVAVLAVLLQFRGESE